MRAAIAHALYDTFHTARLSEHPEDYAQYETYAAAFEKWIAVYGLRIAASADTHPQDGDVQQAPLVSGAVGAAETPKGQTDTPKGTDRI